ncbi:MAG TPA: FHA domain-containing protein [Candidatus Eremiobacteraceae bacterium]|nr:FHA domain-containing protein [Candidatus Eremiobacteraceae bacterium]
MDVTVIRWETLAIVIAMILLAVWAFASGPAEQAPAPAASGPGHALRVEVRRPGMPPEVLIVPDGGLIGRSRACHIILDDETVSKQHARLTLEDGRPCVEDLQSTNGTSLNGKRIEHKSPLRRGDRIGLGTNLIVLVGVTPPALSRQQL